MNRGGLNPFIQFNTRTITMSAALPNDPYYILGVDRNTKFSDIKKKYFILAKKYHPDLNPGNDVTIIFILALLVCEQNVHHDRRGIPANRS